MLLPQLKTLAAELGVPKTTGLRKADLVALITQAQAGSAPKSGSGEKKAKEGRKERPDRADQRPPKEGSSTEQSAPQPTLVEDSSAASPDDGQAGQEPREQKQNRNRRNRDNREPTPVDAETSQEVGARLAAMGMDVVATGPQPEPASDVDRDDESTSRRTRRRRNRDRQNRRRTGLERIDSDPQVSADDVLAPVRGIVDVMDGYAFVRTSGYIAGPDDAYMPLGMVKKYGLRKGDVVTGQIRTLREGDRREKFSPFVALETVNGLDPEKAKDRPEFSKLTPLYPQQRLRLETEATGMIGRIVDMIAPIGKGQRGLIVSPPKAGKTMIMQAIANAITTNNPEVHLMVVLVDERPEEVTDFQRTTSGEVIASTFDRPADDHTTISELAIERAKRLVEMGRDVVILLDGITRLGRAYNLAAPASGRILSGGVDSAALYPPKKFFGAARNIENGGSLTILATALIETGSKMDEVIFEEFKGTGNMELRLRRDLADKRIFPAIDVDASGTRREELLLSREELAIIWKLRRVLSGMEGTAATETLLKQLKKTESNREFLLQISRTTPN
jgi:transcription termination factor Rho